MMSNFLKHPVYFSLLLLTLVYPFKCAPRGTSYMYPKVRNPWSKLSVALLRGAFSSKFKPELFASFVSVAAVHRPVPHLARRRHEGGAGVDLPLLADPEPGRDHRGVRVRRARDQPADRRLRQVCRRIESGKPETAGRALRGHLRRPGRLRAAKRFDRSAPFGARGLVAHEFVPLYPRIVCTGPVKWSNFLLRRFCDRLFLQGPRARFDPDVTGSYPHADTYDETNLTHFCWHAWAGPLTQPRRSSESESRKRRGRYRFVSPKPVNPSSCVLAARLSLWTEPSVKSCCQGSNTFSKTAFHAFSILNEKTAIPSLTFVGPTFYWWSTIQKNICKTVISS